MVKLYAWVGLSAALLMLMGCGDTGGSDVTANVTGNVTYGNKPLSDGDIVFQKPGEVAKTLKIQNGKFEGPVKPGDYRVEIYAYRKGEAMPPDTPGAEEGPSMENYIPAQYNANSKLSAKVTADGKNEFNFDLTK